MWLIFLRFRIEDHELKSNDLINQSKALPNFCTLESKLLQDNRDKNYNHWVKLLIFARYRCRFKGGMIKTAGPEASGSQARSQEDALNMITPHTSMNSVGTRSGTGLLDEAETSAGDNQFSEYEREARSLKSISDTVQMTFYRADVRPTKCFQWCFLQVDYSVTSGDLCV